MGTKDRLAEIVGEDNVLDALDAIERYGRDYSVEGLRDPKLGYFESFFFIYWGRI